MRLFIYLRINLIQSINIPDQPGKYKLTLRENDDIIKIIKLDT